jgi:predicted O-methyltransferase YrrM
MTAITEVTFQFLDPQFPNMYDRYKPRPWDVQHATWAVNGNIEAVLRKRPLEDPSTVLGRESIGRGAMQKHSEISGLYSLISKNPPSAVVEIGTARGGVFYGLCQIAKSNATIVSIDLPGGDFGGGYDEDSIKLFSTYGQSEQKLGFLRLDSHDPRTKESLLGYLKTIDLLFIDGDHTYEGVKKDYEMYSGLVKKGLIVFHDICKHTNVPTCQVDRFWKEVKKGKKTMELIDPMDKTWGGIGVIFK